MSLELDLKELLEELKRYFECERILGLDAIALAKEIKKEEGRETDKKELKHPVFTEKKAGINVEEQLGIFDTQPRKMTLEEIREDIGDCTRCKLHQGRTNIVFGEGNPKARLVFVGEGPGEEEDKQASREIQNRAKDSRKESRDNQ